MTQQHALIATFYAFKGGTGRTLALSNVARILAEKMGYRVGLVDLDIESPGLVHEPLCAALEGSCDSRKSDLLLAIDEQKGFLECYLDRVSADPKAVPIIDHYVYALGDGTNGSIILMPTAKGSVSKSDKYTESVERFMQALAGGAILQPNSETASEDLPPADLPSKITWEIISDFIRRYELDFLFIDGRTGSGLFSPVYIYSIPHLLVLFFGLNDQNVLGSLSVLRAKAEGVSSPVPVFLVASPVPTVGPADLERRLAFIAEQLADEREKRGSENDGSSKHVYALPAKVDHILPYTDAASYGEVYFPGSYPHSLLADAYRRLAVSIESLVVRRAEPIDIVKDIALPAGQQDVAVEIAVENVHEDVLTEQFEAPAFRVRGYSAENRNAPWEKLLQVETESEWLSIRDGFPDVIVVPQIHLQTLSNKLGGNILYDVNKLRLINKNDGQRSLNFEFLDTYYPHWRRWCSVGQSIAALPFSVNAMLLCANEDALYPICKAYWQERSKKPPGIFFLPSSWPGLMALLEAGQRTGIDLSSVFRIVGSDRGLYYEWLNMVASFGSFDVIQAEGRLLQDVLLNSPQTVEATKQFVRLASLSGRNSTMDMQIKEFADDKLALYMGWTDSFRFRRNEDSSLAGVSVTSLTQFNVRSEGSDFARKDQNIRLGRSPRDMRHARTSLVDGWLMTFPKKSADALPLQGLVFADKFLDPERQRRLLRRGFPSPCARVVDQELDALYTDRLAASGKTRTQQKPAHGAEQSFEVFLDTMRSAIGAGRWVASPEAKVDDLITEALMGLIASESPNVDSVMRTLHKDVRERLDVR